MAAVSDNKIREMEEEMSRFEKEIAQTSSVSSNNSKNFNGANNKMAANSGSTNVQRSQINHSERVMGCPPSLQPHPSNFTSIGSTPHLQFLPHQIRGGGPMIQISAHESSNMMGGSQAAVGFSKSYNEMDDMSNSDQMNYSTPAIISAKPTLYSAKAKQNNSVTSKVVVMTESPVVTPIPSFTSAATTSFGKVGPAAYPQNNYEDKRKEKKPKKIVRTAGGQVWDDNTLLDWDHDDFRVFCGDLGNDVTDEVLTRTFSRYPSFQRAKVVRDKRTNKTKGFGFISFRDPQDFIKAMKDMNGKYVGSRPIKLRKSNWKDRNIEVAKKKLKEKQKLGLR